MVLPESNKTAAGKLDEEEMLAPSKDMPVRAMRRPEYSPADFKIGTVCREPWYLSMLTAPKRICPEFASRSFSHKPMSRY